jgi:putative addiction module component (TIGR02574 family)
MTRTTLKKELHQAIDNIQDEQFLKAIYTILSEKMSEYHYSLSRDQEAELDRRIAAHKSGESKSYSWPQAKKLIKSAIKK